MSDDSLGSFVAGGAGEIPLPEVDPPVLAKARLAVDVLDRWASRIGFAKAKHTYTLDDEPLPSVTTVIDQIDKPPLVRWMIKEQQRVDAVLALRMIAAGGYTTNEDDFVAAFMAASDKESAAEKARRKAASTGSDVHGLIEHWCHLALGLETTMPEVSVEAEWLAAGWEFWASSQGFRPFAIERRLGSPGNVCGTLDCVGSVEGELAVIDWKTSPQIYPEHRLQNAAYRAMLVEMGGPELPGCIVCLPKTGEPTHVTWLRDDVKEGWAIVRSLARLWRWRRADGALPKHLR